MKRLLTLSLVAFTFAASHVAIASPSDTPAGKPEAAMDEQMKGSKETVDADKAETKGKKAHHKHKVGHKKHKKADDASK